MVIDAAIITSMMSGSLGGGTPHGHAGAAALTDKIGITSQQVIDDTGFFELTKNSCHP